MKYINKVTKAVITTNGEVSGDNWIKLENYTGEAVTEAPEEPTKAPVKKTAKKTAKEKNDAE